MLKRSGAPRTGGYEWLAWGEGAVDGTKKGIVTTPDGGTVLYDPKDWDIKCDSLGCHIRWSWSVDTPGRVSIRGRAVNLWLSPSTPTLRAEVKDVNSTLVGTFEFELLRFKGMRMFETCVLAYSFPWDLRDGQAVELDVVAPQPDPDTRLTEVESTGSRLAKVTAANVQIAQIEVALDAFEVDLGRYPTTSEGLGALIEKPASDSEGWQRPYLKRDLPKDPWDSEYQYRYPGTYNKDGYDLYSLGPDRKLGGDDDITN